MVYLLSVLVKVRGKEVCICLDCVCLFGISPVFRADRVTLGLTVSCISVPLDISFSPCPFSSTLLWSNAVWHVRGLMLRQAFCCPFGFLSNRIRLEKKTGGRGRDESMSQQKNSVFILIKSTSYSIAKASADLCFLCIVKCHLFQCSKWHHA